MGVIKVTQNVGTTNKVCYPFMKGKKTPIAFCPVWYKNSTTSFLPAGLKSMFKHDAENASASWETLQFYRTASDTNKISRGDFGKGYLVSPYHFNMIDTQATATNINHLAWNSIIGSNYISRADAGNNRKTLRVNRGFILYPTGTSNDMIFGIAPFTNHSNATAVFGCIAAIPTGSSAGNISAGWYSRHLDYVLAPKDGGGGYGGGDPTTATAWSAGPSAWSVHKNYAMHSQSYSYQKPQTYTNAWPDSKDTIFTGMKCIGEINNSYLMFWQFSSTIEANNMFTPPVYYIEGHNQTLASAKIYDSWIGLKY